MASVSVVPALIDALFAAAQGALPTVTVYDGIDNSEEFGDYLMIGVDDPDGQDWAHSGNGTHAFETVGGGAYNDITEEGDIACAAMSWNGDGDLKAARDAAYAIAEALAAVCRTTPTMGLDRLLWVLYGANWDLLQIRGDGGSALARLEFQLHFQALI